MKICNDLLCQHIYLTTNRITLLKGDLKVQSLARALVFIP